jgi:CoA:oxalate CoA-transferase
MDTESPQAPQAAAAYPLTGIRVIDLTHMLAGPYSSWLLGALGADVVKVEMPGRGDFTRRLAPFLGDESIYFMSLNRNKRSIELNLKHEGGREAFERLVESADVLLENNRPGVMARLGLDYASLSARNPRLVYASVSGLGQTGPYSERPAYDAVVQAMAGTMSITGEEGRGPVRVGASIGDIGAGLFATIGILAALNERGRTGKGAYVDVAMLDAQLAILENAVARYLNTGEVPRRIGSRHPLIAPFQAFPTRDHPIVICCDTEAQWERLCQVIGCDELIGRPPFEDGNSRAQHHAELEPLLVRALASRGRDEWLAALEAAAVPAGPINSIADVVADPHVQARGMIARLARGAFVAQPIHMSTHATFPERAPPALGQHTREVLTEVGYTSDQIDRLARTGAIAGNGQ